jgi:hypothetical protein
MTLLAIIAIILLLLLLVTCAAVLVTAIWNESYTLQSCVPVLF